MAQKHQMHLVIATGGTGGHFYPALSVAGEVAARGVHVTFAVAGQHAEKQREVARENGFEADILRALRLPRRLPEALFFLPRLLAVRRSARRWLQEREADVVLGMGSFAAVPVCLAAASAGCRLFLHEGNAVLGRANRVLAHRADALVLSLPLAGAQKVPCPTQLTGMPLRRGLLAAAEAPPRPAAVRARYGISADKPTLLVFGGSQGADALNALLFDTASGHADRLAAFQVIHLTGRDDNRGLEQIYRQAGIRACVLAYESAIENCYAAADLVLARAGAATIAELALFAKPAILIPYPHAANDHQTVNARLLAQRNAAVHLPQHEATPDRLVEVLRTWIDSARQDEWARRAEALRAFAYPDAAAQVAELVVRTQSR